MEGMQKLFDEFFKAIEEKNLEKSNNAINSIWLFWHLSTLPSTHPELKELNYLKVAVTTNSGGKYMLSFTHVDGPKIEFKKDNELTIPKNEEVV